MLEITHVKNLQLSAAASAILLVVLALSCSSAEAGADSVRSHTFPRDKVSGVRVELNFVTSCRAPQEL